LLQKFSSVSEYLSCFLFTEKITQSHHQHTLIHIYRCILSHCLRTNWVAC
jgi:hypothetical protein